MMQKKVVAGNDCGYNKNGIIRRGICHIREGGLMVVALDRNIDATNYCWMLFFNGMI